VASQSVDRYADSIGASSIVGNQFAVDEFRYAKRFVFAPHLAVLAAPIGASGLALNELLMLIRPVRTRSATPSRLLIPARADAYARGFVQYPKSSVSSADGF
jgi:hypothetical protein